MLKFPQHKLARYLNILLELVLNHFSRFVVKDFFEVIERIRNINPENTFLLPLMLKNSLQMSHWMKLFNFVVNCYTV